MSFDLVVIGGGAMGTALVHGLLGHGLLRPSQLAICELSAARRTALATEVEGVAVSDTVPPCAAALIAVKPAGAAEATAGAAAAGARRVLSIAAGVRIAALEAAAGDGVAVIRAMPNTPALVGAGAAAYAGGSSATADDLRWAAEVLGAVGIAVEVDEEQLDVVTGLSGSGPAYLFLVVEALVDAAVDNGLDREVASRLANQLLLGAGTLLAQRGDPAALRAMVTSPNGTTAAGLQALADHDLHGAMAAAVRAATVRSRELAG